MSTKIPKLKMSTHHVPLEIELEIAKRLPVKSLIRFISVSKAWKSMIECSEFVAGHRVLPTQPPHLMIKYEVGHWKEKTLEVKFVCFVDDDTFPQQKFVPTLPPLLQLLGGSRMVDSSCGLLYLDGSLLEPDGSVTSVVVLWNPWVRKSIAVALPTMVLWPFDYVVGFGVCPQTNDPKLVQITYIDDRDKIESISCIPFQVMVFTLSSGEWRCLCSNQLPRKSIEFDSRCSKVIGQFIYWLANDRTVDYDEDHNLIMSFDLSNEEFGEVDLPDSLTQVSAESCLLISRLKESLAVVEFCHDFFVVWIMDHDVQKSFKKLFAVEVPHASITWILGFRERCEPIFELWEDDRQDSLLFVYERRGNFKQLGVLGNRCSFFGSYYTESLLLLDQDDGRIIRCGGVKRVGTGRNQVIYID